MVTIETAVALVISGMLVGFVNTMAAGGTIISMTLFMALGLPIVEASGTNRIAVVLQNLVSSFTFRRQNLLHMKTAMCLAVPVVIGVIIGAQFSMVVSERVFSIFFATGLVLMALMMLLKPDLWLKGREGGIRRMSPLSFFLLVLTGFYGGSVYVGLGYFLIAIFVMGLGYDLLKANALKSFMAFATTPFSLVIYMMHGQVNYTYGLIHAVGNIIGAYLAAHYASALGNNFIRWLLIAIIVISLLDTLNIVDLNALVRGLL